MEIATLENFLSVNKGYIRGQRKNETSGGDFQTLLKGKTNGEENTNSLVTEWKFNETKTPLEFDLFRFTNTNISGENVLSSEEIHPESVITEDQRSFLEKIVSDLLSVIDEKDAEQKSELQQLIDELDSNGTVSWIDFLDRLNQLTISFNSNTNIKEGFAPIFKIANRFILNETMESSRLESSVVRTLQTFVEKYGSNLDLQSVYDRWDVGEKLEGSKIVFPVPFNQNKFQIDQQVKEVLAKNEMIQETGNGNKMIRIPLNESTPISNENMEQMNQNDENAFDSFSFNWTSESSVKEGKLLEEQMNEMGDISVKGNEKSDRSLFVAAKSQSNQLTVPNESLQLVDEDNQPITYKQFERDFSTILSRGNYIKNGNVQRLTVKLHPEHLGSLKIELIQKQGEIVAKITSSTERAKELLETQLSSLRHAFAQQNINVNRIDLQAEGAFDGFEGQQDTFYESSSGFSNNQNEEEETNQESVETTFQETLFNMEI
ncbi:flagellar hook-length control protein FliK [Fervidibacillus albus]|uniref:Flagellar hook-length control protein FliK n=1 Tax=Fervidibacillus albus TaxID=2980026 RepID=A0A9E8LWF7_9BACI|nr:flagellar hook-length control protein FliK [Fervidibacillus albus]WAA10717.1 flagellar hook-length control protein FliK [Fervidibacillus albus]